ncbi:MAG: site-specific DNA-methyltransferase, partial [Dehalococcoidia bacterium]|nr:site-specific DNA-methyltransferase [Dehalococcoidia bacterium]
MANIAKVKKMAIETNVLYYGDNLEILRKYIPDSSVDLIYLDPPFNSSATYNVLFKEPTGKPSQAQMSAFEDTWHWGLDSEKGLQEIAASSNAPTAVKEFMSVLPKLVGRRTDMSAYLTMMCIRLIELRRVLKDTGSLYLHCDPTASHYLKIMLDTIFGPHNFRNEISWKRTAAHSSARRYGPVHDILLFYSKTAEYKWNIIYTAYDKEYEENFYRHIDENRRRYQLIDLSAPGDRAGTRAHYEWKGKLPPRGRHWAQTIDVMTKYENEGRIVYSSTGTPRLKQYLDKMPGMKIQDTWTDINPVSSHADERLGYATQKPETLLERIIQSSSGEGDIVLDPFCGCGTAVVAAQKLNRKWIGMDVTHLAIGLMKWRL